MLDKLTDKANILYLFPLTQQSKNNQRWSLVKTGIGYIGVKLAGSDEYLTWDC